MANKRVNDDGSMKAVIYARYSSENQREESIEGQIRECYAFARKNNISVIAEYIDRAFSAKTDRRPDFQRMIKDSARKNFNLVLVWKLDRFARNRYDSANYKATLKRNGVKVMSVTESISEGSEGILLESVLEGMAEYYSAELSEKVMRGHHENALKCRYNGGTLPIGFSVDKDQNYHVDPITSPYIVEAFTMYDEGRTMKEIVAVLNQHEVKNTRGGRISIDNVASLLKNRRYTGEYIYRDIVVPDGIPAIVPKDLFDRVQEKIARNKKAPARHKAEDDYILTTKLFCGECKSLMVGESGTSATKQVYHYYKCVSAKKHTGCNMKPLRKAWIEDIVIEEIRKALNDDKLIDDIVHMFMEFQQKENTVIPHLEHELAETEKAINNMLNAIEQGIITPMTKKRLDALEEKHRNIETDIVKEKMKHPLLTEEQVRFWFERMREYDITVLEQRKRLIDTFVNAIFVYNDRLLFTFNYKRDAKTVLFSDLKSSDITKGVRPRKRVDYFCSFFFILQGFLALFQCPKILFFLPPNLPHFGSILGLVHTLVHTSKKFISRMSRGHKFYSRVKITFSVTSRSKFFCQEGGIFMASITPKPNGTYQIRISCGLDSSSKQIMKSKTFRPSKPNLSYQRLNKEIENFIAAFEEEAKSDNPSVRPDKMRFAEFCTKYLELKKTVLSPNSYVFYEMIINTELIPKFGRMKLRDIKTYHVQEFIQYLTTEKKCRNGNGDCISPTTVRRYATVLRSILSLAYQLEYTDVDVGASRRIIFPKTDTCEVEVFTEEEVQQILTALDSEPINIRALVEMAIFTGMRRGEIVGLKWDDIDFTNRTVSVKRSIYKPKDGKALEKDPKSKSSIRTISIPEHLISTLLDYKLHQDRHISFNQLQRQFHLNKPIR